VLCRRKVFKIDHHRRPKCGKKARMTNYSSLDFDCPVCGAMPKEKCRNLAGSFRFESHVERKWIAQDQRLERPPAMAIPARSRVFAHKQAP
jgi:predicted RNA-binding Zn-ribbon protein involved in translation (DUF1610 family)